LTCLYHAVMALIIVSPALYNRYPLMYFDSGAYMEMAANLLPSFHRAFGYPLLMKWSGWVISNWPIILIQGAIVSMLLDRVMRGLMGAGFRRSYHFLTSLALVLGSALPWYASQLMPDIWTFILVLAFTALWVSKPSRLDAVFYGTLICVAALTHLSHIPLLLLLLISTSFWLWRKEGALPNRMVWMTSTLSLVLSFLITCSFNAVNGMGFRLSLASNAFVVANLGEMGILKHYLDEQCPSDEYADLCERRHDLPKETYGYLWDANGPVQLHEGGWQGANEAYAPIVHAFTTNPRYMKWFLFAGVKATVKQMFQIELGSGLQYAYGEGSPPYWPMKTHFKQELNEYLTSVQNKGDELPLQFFRWIHYVTIILSLAFIGWAILERRISKEMGLLLAIFLFSYFFNAAITGVLANVYERLQVRLLPLLQFSAMLVFIQLRLRAGKA
jgi:hypothetical protein